MIAFLAISATSVFMATLFLFLGISVDNAFYKALGLMVSKNV